MKKIKIIQFIFLNLCLFILLSSCSNAGNSGSSAFPSVALLQPNNLAKNVSLIPSIQLQFNETVTGVNRVNVTLHEGSTVGNVVAIGNIIPGDDFTYTFSPNSKLLDVTKYYIVLESGIKNTGGTSLPQTIFSFTTGNFLVPSVTMTKPSNNAINISSLPSIQLKFNELVTGVDSTNVTLHEGSTVGKVVAIGNIISGDDFTYTFSPNFKLLNATKYYIVLESGIKNTSGTSLPQTIFSFTTGNFLVPSVTMTKPSNNAINVSSLPSIQLKFNELVTGVDSTNVTLHEGSTVGKVVAIGNIISGDDFTYTFSPNSKLLDVTKYYIVLESGIKNSSDISLPQTIFNFETSTYFVSYYPKDCITNNIKDGVTGTCICVEDPETKDIWYANLNFAASSWDSVNNVVNSLNNNSGTCGFTREWKLPSHNQMILMGDYLTALNKGNGNYEWFNNNGFNGMISVHGGYYWGESCNGIDCASIYAWSFHPNLQGGTVVSPDNKNVYNYGWAVHSGE